MKLCPEKKGLTVNWLATAAKLDPMRYNVKGSGFKTIHNMRKVTNVFQLTNGHWYIWLLVMFLAYKGYSRH